MNRRSQILLMALVLPAWGAGLFFSMKERTRQLRPSPQHKWFARYAALEPLLGDSQTVALVYDAPTQGQGKSQLFKAQYVLAPRIVQLANKLPLLETHRVRRMPLIYDFRKPRVLEQTLAETATKAEERGFSMTTTQVDWALALVQFRKN